MAPCSIEVPPGYHDPGLLAFNENGHVCIRTPEEVYNCNLPESPFSSSNESDPNFYRGSEKRIELQQPSQAFLWNMSAIFAYDAQMRAEQAECHRIRIENARRNYRARASYLTHPEGQPENMVTPQPAVETHLMEVIGLLERQHSLTHEGSQRWKLIEGWLLWARASIGMLHTVQLENLLNVHRFLEEGVDENGKANFVDFDVYGSRDMESDGSKVIGQHPVKADAEIKPEFKVIEYSPYH